MKEEDRILRYEGGSHCRKQPPALGLKEEREITPENVERRGAHMIRIGKSRNILLDRVRLHADDDVLPYWEGKYNFVTPDEVTLRNCEID